MMLEIIHRDDDLVAIHKPSGLLVHRSPIAARDEIFALQLLRDQLGQRVHPVHRLDRGTSGVLLFALGRAVAAAIGEQFRANAVVRHYLAVVRGHPPLSGCIDHPLQRRLDEVERRLGRGSGGRGRGADDTVADEGPEDTAGDSASRAQTARTHFRRLASIELPWQVDRYPSSRYALLELCPLTGRRHQLRRHLKHLSHPIIGDATYGKGRHNRMFAEQLGSTRLLLACTRLQLRHPADGRLLCLNAAPAADFSSVLTQLDWTAAVACAAAG